MGLVNLLAVFYLKNGVYNNFKQVASNTRMQWSSRIEVLSIENRKRPQGGTGCNDYIMRLRNPLSGQRCI
jgi:hypothetical protein